MVEDAAEPRGRAARRRGHAARAADGVELAEEVVADAGPERVGLLVAADELEERLYQVTQKRYG